MNIWCVSKYVTPPNYGSSPSRLYYLADEFNKLGHNATLITSDSNQFANFPNTDKTYNFDKWNFTPIVWLKTYKYSKSASVDRVLSWLDFERKLFFLDTKKLSKPDVVIVSSLSIFSIIYGFYLKKRFNAFLVFEIRDIWPLTMTEEGNFSKYHPLVILIGLIEKFGYKKADLIVGTMPGLFKHVANILGFNKQVYCSPLGFDKDSYSDDLQVADNIFTNVFPSNKFVIGYAGSLGITNALEPFINTVKKLKNNQEIHFMVIGNGDLKPKFENELVDCKNITFLPRTEQKNIKYFLQNCDVLYLSTKKSKVWDYGQSMNKVVEYMLAGKPILASYSGFPSMINEAECGWLVNSADEVILTDTILEISKMSKQQLETIGKRGKDWIIKNRNYAKLASDYIEIITSIQNKRKS